MDIRTVLAGFVGSAAQGVRTRSPVADYYTRYLGALLQRALGQWATVHASGVKCGLELRGLRGERARCGGPAIGACMVCGESVCVAHALVSPEHILCLGCALSAAAKLRGAPRQSDGESYVSGRPSWETDTDAFGGGGAGRSREAEKRREYLSRLGLDEGASEDEIRVRYRKLASEHHPDRARTPQTRESATRKLKELNEAYSYLTRRRAA